MIVSIVLYLPMIAFMWILPQTETTKQWLLAAKIWRGTPLSVYILWLIATIFLFFIGNHFFKSAYASIKHGSANMDVLICLSTTAAYSYGTFLSIAGLEKYEDDDELLLKIMEHAHNFETTCVLIMIVLIGKYIETYSKSKTVNRLSDLASLKVTTANLVEESKSLQLNCKYKTISIDLLQKKDFVIIFPGDTVPTDGEVILGRGTCNESMLTGEAAPVMKEIGGNVFGGSLLTTGTLIFKVTKSAEDATLKQIIKMVENAQNTKAPIQGFADKISAYFVPLIVILAIIDWIIWFSLIYTDQLLVGEHPMKRFQFAFDFGISTLVIACPCALGLATPTAVMVGTGLAASYGILIKGADVLEKIRHIDTIVFDKTGTLTSGKQLVKDIINCK